MDPATTYVLGYVFAATLIRFTFGGVREALKKWPF